MIRKPYSPSTNFSNATHHHIKRSRIARASNEVDIRACGISIVLLVLVMLGVPSVARAADECGLVSGPNPVVICDGTNNGGLNEGGESNVTPSSETGDSDPYAAGIRYNVPGITLNLDGTAAPLGVTRAGGQGIASIGGGVAPNVINALGLVNITTQGGSSSYGLYARNTVGAATINYDGGTIQVGAGWNGFGVYADTRGAGDATINYNGGVISTVGNYSIAVYAQAFGAGAAVINYTSGTITGGTGWWVGGPFAVSHGAGDALVDFADGNVTTSGWRGFGAYAGPLGTGDGTVIARSGAITTSGVQAVGAHVYVVGPGALFIETGAALNITTSGSDANGVLGTIQDAINSSTLDIISAARINTTGSNSHGIWGWHGGSGAIRIDNTGDVSAAGDGADGVRAQANTVAGYDVNVLGGTTASGGGSAAGIRVIGVSGGTVNVASDATVDGSASGVALRDGDLDNDGIDEIGGNVVFTTAGTVFGDAIGGRGDDIFNLAGGTMTGDIYGDDILASGADGDDQFNWSGGDLNSGFFGGNGSDNVVISAAANYEGAEILDGGDDVSTADGWIDTLSIRDLDATVPASNLRNWESIVVERATVTNANASALTTGNEPGLGLILNTAAIFNAGTAFNLTGNFTIASGATFNGTAAGNSATAIVGNVSNNGVFNMQDPGSDDIIAIDGHYTGNAGLLNVDTVLGDDNSATDLLTISGDASGSTTVNVRNLGGSGALTNNGIEIIRVGGLAGARFLLDGDFVTAQGDQAVVGGAYAYTLNQQGDGDWTLDSRLIPVPAVSIPTGPVVTVPLFQPAAPVYEALARNLLTLNDLPTLQQRIGNRSWAERSDIGLHGTGGWLRLSAGHRSIDSSSTTRTATDIVQNQLQIGFDIPTTLGNHSEMVLGINGSFGRARSEIDSVFGNGDIDSDNYTLGLTTTWYERNGWYADAQLQYSRSNSELSSTTLGQLGDVDGHTISGSLETGKRIAINPERHLTLTPQLQLRYADASFDRFIGVHGEQVSVANANSLKGRVGLSVDHQTAGTDGQGHASLQHLYGIANIVHDFDGETDAVVSGTSLLNKPDQTFAELGVGGSYTWAGEKYAIYGELTAGTSLENFADSHILSGSVGFRMRW